MKVHELIAKLQETDQELTVCLADWNEEWVPPAEWAVVVKAYANVRYDSASEQSCITGPCVVIGEDSRLK